MFRRDIQNHVLLSTIFLTACASSLERPAAKNNAKDLEASAKVASTGLLSKILHASLTEPFQLTGVDDPASESAESVFFKNSDRLAYQSNGQIFVRELSDDSPAPTRLISDAGFNGNLQMDWEKLQLYYTNSSRPLALATELSVSENSDVFTFDLVSGKKNKFTRSIYYDGEAFPSRDGRWVVFSSAREGDFELYMARSDGTRLVRLTQREGYDGSPSFSPDMKYLLWRGFRAKRKDISDLYRARIIFKGDVPMLQDVKNLTVNDNALYLTPAWTNDSTHILFASNRANRENIELYVSNLEFNCIQRLTDSSGVNLFPTVSSEGRFVSWTSTRKLGKSQIFVAPFSVTRAPCDGSKIGVELSGIPYKGVDGR